MILSEITRIPNEGEFVFISKPSQLNRYVNKSAMYDVMDETNVIKVTDTIHLKKEFRFFHKYIAHNIIPKADHHNQVTTMDAFIIYKAAIDEPLNLNYIILKEMADVRNHNTWAFPYGALLTKVFNHFGVKLGGQRNQGLSKGFSLNTIKKGIDFDSSEEERDVEMEYENMHDFANIRAMIPYIQNEGVQVDPNAHEQEQDEGYETKCVDEDILEGVHMEMEFPMHGVYPTQEGTSRQGGTPVWAIKLQASLEKIKNQQAEIIQNQRRQEGYIDRLGDAFYELRRELVKQGLRVDRIGNLCETMHEENSQHFSNIHSVLEGL